MAAFIRIVFREAEQAGVEASDGLVETPDGFLRVPDAGRVAHDRRLGIDQLRDGALDQPSLLARGIEWIGVQPIQSAVTVAIRVDWVGTRTDLCSIY